MFTTVPGCKPNKLKKLRREQNMIQYIYSEEALVCDFQAAVINGG